MKEPTIICVVTHGDYSAYDIDGMFSTREKAEEWIEHTYDPSYYNIVNWLKLRRKQNEGTDKGIL